MNNDVTDPQINFFKFEQIAQTKRKILRYLTLAERKEIERLMMEGLPYSRIAEKLNRSPRGILNELKKNTADGEYNAEKAHHLATVALREKQQKAASSSRRIDDAKESEVIDLYHRGRSYRAIAISMGIGKTTVRDILKRNGIEANDPMHTLQERVEGLEFAIQTLTELLEEIKNDKKDK